MLAAQRDDRRAQEQLLRRYEPLARGIARRLRVPAGCDRHDIAQEARIGLLAAIHAWEPQRGPFPAFARLCVRNHALKAVDAAGARKHQLLTQALPLDAGTSPVAPQDPSADPIAMQLTHERLDGIRARLSSLTAKERTVLAGVMNGKSHRQLAAQHGTSRKAITLTMRRVRDKLDAHEALAA